MIFKYSKQLIIKFFFHTRFFFHSICNNCIKGANLTNGNVFFLWDGGHFAEMPTVANRRELGVKNRENLPTS